ncbi:SpoIIE family protein phosphatase [Oscillatoriales cyanobacterium LEGE 11467]|uniref:SpoIIE family protein phosphatase n=1 Tax=Zarconia navalis LEGE 11467 TaxID=1828826 RepID=A0A928Z8X1_9CYAN|nr:SpoIIE family protein phosphatase [Zarconia navalis]MBE9041123.1 SpoIIE family protein phosphatase [Zarconia navalis LEGE 11467]
MTQILLIDDDPTTRLVLKRALTKQGYKVAVAPNGEEGVAAAQKLRPGLIICDWMMPVMDGLEVCRRVKANPELSTTFFILLTARGAIEDRVTGLDTGADEFLAKPIEINELQARVRAGLRIHQLSQDLQRQKHMLETELNEAADYVRSLLPTSVKDAPVTIDARFIPSKQLGGDCYDFEWLDPNHLAIYLLDVSGHGVGSALLSISVLNVLRSRSLPNTSFYKPSEVLKALNQTFQGSNNSEFYDDKYFTIWYGVYHIESRQLVYASAGHPPAILVVPSTDDRIEIDRLKTPSIPIGMFPESEYTSKECKIAVSSTLYIFSDGVYEIQQPDGTVWGLNAFTELLASYPAKNSDTLDRLLNYIRALNSYEILDDDLSLLQLKFP